MIINVSLAFDAGASRDGDLAGLASLTNSLVDAGGKTLSEEKIANNFADVGSVFFSDVKKDYAMLGVKFLAEEQAEETTINTLLDLLSVAKIPDNTFTRVKSQTLQSIKHQQQDPETVAFDNLFQQLYPNHPYGHNNLGTESSLKNISLAKVVNFYNRYYVAQNGVVIIVGDINRKDAENLARKIAKTLPQGATAKPLPVAMPNKAEEKFIPFQSSQTTMVMGEVAISPQNEDYYALKVAENILGGGIQSWLSREIRVKQGLVYSVYSYFMPMKLRGPFFITLQTATENVTTARLSIDKILKKFISKGPTEQELNLAKSYINGRFYASFDSNQGFADQILRQYVYNLPDNYFESYQDKINKVTLNHLKQAVAKNINLAGITYVTVGSENGG